MHASIKPAKRGRYRSNSLKGYRGRPYCPSAKRDVASIRLDELVFYHFDNNIILELLFNSDVDAVGADDTLVVRFLYLILIPFCLTVFIIGKVIALLSLLDAEFDADHIREKRKRTSGSGGQFFRLIFSKYSKLILPFSFR